MAHTMAATQQDLRLVRPVPDLFPWYIRAGYNDHRMLETMLARGESRISRVVMDAAFLARHEGLTTALQSKRAELVLDPRVAELATPIAKKTTLQMLDWYSDGTVSDPTNFDQQRIDAVATSIARTAILHGFSAVIAPAHALDDDQVGWIDVDVKLTQALRQALNANGGSGIRINYPLIIPYSWLSSDPQMLLLSGAMSTVPVDAIWLRVSNFSNDKSAAAVRNYIEGTQLLLRANRTLVADHITGVTGLALIAFGAAGGLAHGVGAKESFRLANWYKPSAGGFGAGTRIFVSDTDLYFGKASLEPLLNDPVIRTKLGCRNKHCCPRGVHDMMSNHKAHLINSRFDQLAQIQGIPDSRKAQEFVRQTLMPMGTRLMKLDHALARYPELQRKVQKKRRFVDDVTIALSDLVKDRPAATRSLIPKKLPFRPSAVANNSNIRPTL